VTVPTRPRTPRQCKVLRDHGVLEGQEALPPQPLESQARREREDGDDLEGLREDDVIIF